MTETDARVDARGRGDTSVALIEAAERLFGQQGIENVSLRQVRIEAGAANNSAIAYHFKDREDLVRAIWAYRLPVLDVARRAMIDDVVSRNEARVAAAVLRTIVIPNYDLRDSTGVHRYAAFVRNAMRWRQGALIRNARLTETPASVEALSLYLALRPDLPSALMLYRLRHASGLFYDMVVERDAAIAAGDDVIGEDDFLAEAIGMMEGACLGRRDFIAA
ncbi:TetR/AcrR family transcriptional regulator [Sphingomonas sp. S6]|jgi:AcrR family transcriptional regulator|uniref:TetR/AcrR family transcriptional regulator n=1 Tax=Sphingomonas sp. S6 TaxID=3368600 RepID=UPI000FB818AD|nr:helix-turn-helix domain-containing protein [uncultured Sphingomonas sp.]RTL21013.1 MAG: TetR/AcrR family transcriptional regulator [Sphingomonadaceae bacterium]